MEAQALRHMTEVPFIGQSDLGDGHRCVVQTPRLLYFDEANTTQVYEFIPESTTLLAYAQKHYAAPTSKELEGECLRTGKAIGSWMNGFNQHSASQPELRRCAVENRDAQPIRHQFLYGFLSERIEEFPAILGEAGDVLLQLLQMANEELKDEDALQVVHGDLTPMK
jgi:hypothetical protein